MKTFLAIIGGLALLVIALFAVLVFIGVREAAPLLGEAQDYADDTIAAVGADWDVDELLDRAAPEMLQAGSRADFEQVTNLGKRSIGSLVSAEPAVCELTQYAYTTETGKVAQASCATTATHERGNASYKVNLINRDDTWQLLFFFFNAEVTEEAPVQVEFRPAATAIATPLTVSVRGRSVGIGKFDSAEIGIGAETSPKIENEMAN